MVEQFDQNGDTTILEPLEVAAEIVRQFKDEVIENYPNVYNEWVNELELNNAVVSESLKAIIEYFHNIPQPGNLGITKKIITYHYFFFRGTILNQVKMYFEEDMQRIKSEEKIQTPYKKIDHLYINPEPKLLQMRDLVSKNAFVQVNKNTHRKEILDDEGVVSTVAEVRAYNQNELFSPDKKANMLWMTFLDQTLNSLDEWTVDIFEIICNCWAAQPKNNEGFIYFDSNDALALKYHEDINNADFKIRERERFDFMKRVAALSNIWVSERGQDIQIIDKGIKTDIEEYDFTDFTRMFEIQSVRMASSKRTKETKGIYGLNIKPGPVLQKYLLANNYPLSTLHIMGYRYNHFRQRHHKVTLRHLSNVWKNRGTTVDEPYLISTLLDKINFSSDLSRVEVRNRFENMLADFKNDGIIKSWSYTEEIDESKVGKAGWFLNYWSKLHVKIIPSDEIIRENELNRYEIPKMIREPVSKQLVFDLSEEVTETPIVVNQEPIIRLESQEDVLVQIRKIMEERGLSYRKTAQFIGISHVTFQRYIKNETKSNKRNFEKMKAWVMEECKKEGNGKS